MRLTPLVLLLLLAIQFNLILHNSVANTFVTIPAWVAFGAITAAVKLKLILVKILFALKTMGIGSIRFKRSAAIPVNEYDEILEAWNEIEIAAGRSLEFILDSCISGALRKHTAKNSAYNYSADEDRTKTQLSTPDKSYAYPKFVSFLIGSITGSIAACKILEDALQRNGIRQYEKAT